LTRRILAVTAASATVVLALGACASGGATGGATTARGPITIWYSNNSSEIAWGRQMVTAWNADHPKELVKAQEIPAGKSSEEVIGAAITAGNAPCLICHTAPVAVPQFQKQGGLVDLSSFKGGAAYINERSGETAKQYESAGGKFYQMPWKSNPVMIFYTSPPPARSSRAAPRRTRSTRPRRASSTRAGSTSTGCTPPRPVASSSSKTASPPSVTPPASR
jgi:multiple sugar transport system substrate-binding protein